MVRIAGVVRKTKPKCPKCGHKNLDLSEFARSCSIEWTLIDGVYECYGSTDPDAHKVVAKCLKCSYVWRLKGIEQMTELPGFEDQMYNFKDGV